MSTPEEDLIKRLQEHGKRREQEGQDHFRQQVDPRLVARRAIEAGREGEKKPHEARVTLWEAIQMRLRGLSPSLRFATAGLAICCAMLAFLWINQSQPANTATDYAMTEAEVRIRGTAGESKGNELNWLDTNVVVSINFAASEIRIPVRNGGGLTGRLAASAARSDLKEGQTLFDVVVSGRWEGGAMLGTGTLLVTRPVTAGDRSQPAEGAIAGLLLRLSLKHNGQENVFVRTYGRP